MNPTGVSFLVCTYNGAPRIAETLTCLAQQQVPAGVLWEVIFVDNASTDSVAKIARRLWDELGSPAPLRILLEPRPGYKIAMERAISQIRYSYACIVDDDNRLAPDYLAVGVAVLNSNPTIGILGGQNTATFDGQEPSWFPAFQHCYAVGQPLDRAAGGFSSLPDGDVGRNVLWGAGMFVRIEIWTRLQEVGFKSLFTGRQGEKDLTAGEDDELCYIARLLGYQVWYSSKLHLRHHMTDSRMTPTYRDRLFYASVRSAGRLGAYRNALWGRAVKSSGVRSNLVKDILYMSLGLSNRVLNKAFVKAFLQGDTFYLMNCKHHFLTLYNFIGDFNHIRKHYSRVVELKNEVENKFKTIDLELQDGVQQS
ncbi:glycosyltransferase family 2 protein [Hymenobacter sp. BT188]|uniref:glycosyltransferase n=1 Tax=Hymenobacter sp. BT188 TaxID=2763504 RepID=UPI001650E063|nr:glycosyltransferase [Hymenobacter sp. BT188]MBC6607165.1 glycosyltransferase family 2 protein [Hymenobacter sp. BT188]